LEGAQLRAHRSCSAASDLLHSQQNERDRLKVAERHQRETENQTKHDSVFSNHAGFKFNGETKGMCCVSRKIKLPQLEELPEPL
ncbi:unnamed protein product, partial [Onchocerca ochengi]